MFIVLQITLNHNIFSPLDNSSTLSIPAGNLHETSTKQMCLSEHDTGSGISQQEKDLDQPRQNEQLVLKRGHFCHEECRLALMILKYHVKHYKESLWMRAIK